MVIVIRQMSPLFSKIDLNKLWRDVQNEETVICAKFGKYMCSISNVIGRKTKWLRFFGLPGISNIYLFAFLGILVPQRSYQNGQKAE